MPKVSKDSTSQGGDHSLVVDRAEDLDGHTQRVGAVQPAEELRKTSEVLMRNVQTLQGAASG